MNTFVVYKHTSPSGKVYIGITSKNVNTRWRKNGEGYKDNIYFWNAIQKYGWDNFKHEILFTNLTKQEACNKEIELIAAFNCMSPNGYNNSVGGEFTKWNATSIEKMKQSLKGKTPWNKGVPMTEEAKHHLSEYNKNNPQKYWLGKKFSEETRKKLSDSHKGKKRKPLSEETKLKISMSNKGKKVTVENLKKLSKPVRQYDLNGTLIAEFPSAKEACRKTGTNCTGIGRCCQYKQSHCNGFVWRFAE